MKTSVQTSVPVVGPPIASDSEAATAAGERAAEGAAAMTPAAEERVRLVRRVTFLGIAVNVAIAAAKAVVGFMFSSQALVADAVHAASDLVTDLALIFSVRYWMAPAPRGVAACIPAASSLQPP